MADLPRETSWIDGRLTSRRPPAPALPRAPAAPAAPVAPAAEDLRLDLSAMLSLRLRPPSVP